MKASDIKNGSVVCIEGIIHLAKEVTVTALSSSGANTLYKVNFHNVMTKLNLDLNYRGDDTLQDGVQDGMEGVQSLVSGDAVWASS